MLLVSIIEKQTIDTDERFFPNANSAHDNGGFCGESTVIN